MPRQPRGKRSTTADGGGVEVVSKNSNADGSVYFEPKRPRPNGSMRPGVWRASNATPKASAEPSQGRPAFKPTFGVR